MKTLNIYNKTAHGTCGEWFTSILGSADECLALAGKQYAEYLWAWA